MQEARTRPRWRRAAIAVVAAYGFLLNAFLVAACGVAHAEARSLDPHWLCLPDGGAGAPSGPAHGPAKEHGQDCCIAACGSPAGSTPTGQPFAAPLRIARPSDPPPARQAAAVEPAGFARLRARGPPSSPSA